MLSVSQDERDRLIAEFWDSVRARLLKHHRRTPDEADLGIGRYRRAMDGRQVGDLLYHQGVERTADAVNGIIDFGVPQVP